MHKQIRIQFLTVYSSQFIYLWCLHTYLQRSTSAHAATWLIEFHITVRRRADLKCITVLATLVQIWSESKEFAAFYSCRAPSCLRKQVGKKASITAPLCIRGKITDFIPTIGTEQNQKENRMETGQCKNAVLLKKVTAQRRTTTQQGRSVNFVHHYCHCLK